MQFSKLPVLALCAVGVSRVLASSYPCYDGGALFQDVLLPPGTQLDATTSQQVDDALTNAITQSCNSINSHAFTGWEQEYAVCFNTEYGSITLSSSNFVWDGSDTDLSPVADPDSCVKFLTAVAFQCTRGGQFWEEGAYGWLVDPNVASCPSGIETHDDSLLK